MSASILWWRCLVCEIHMQSLIWWTFSGNPAVQWQTFPPQDDLSPCHLHSIVSCWFNLWVYQLASSFWNIYLSRKTWWENVFLVRDIEVDIHSKKKFLSCNERDNAVDHVQFWFSIYDVIIVDFESQWLQPIDMTQSWSFMFMTLLYLTCLWQSENTSKGALDPFLVLNRWSFNVFRLAHTSELWHQHSGPLLYLSMKFFCQYIHSWLASEVIFNTAKAMLT